MALDRPYDILDLRDGGELVTRVIGMEEGPIAVTPKDGRPPRIVEGVRLYVPMADKQTAPGWWDLTAQTLKPTLREVAREAIATGRWLKVTKYGVAPGARFSVELLPESFRGPARADTLNQAGP